MDSFSFNIDSNDNSLFVTAQCNNRCLMCSQPPLKGDDINELFENNLSKLANAPMGLTDLGITGGEPTLLGEKLFQLVDIINERLPKTFVHLLSNGRAFANREYASKIAQTRDSGLLIGIPLHSDYWGDHDKITQVGNSFNETIKGLYNLAEFGVDVELRIVINKINYQRLFQLSDFIYKNLPFVRYVSFMGMEYTGYAVKNHESIWVDPQAYSLFLEKAVLNLATWKIDVSVFNLPLCCIPNSIHSYACRSISDWKVKYLEDCNYCQKKDICCGLFATSKKQLEIRPFL